MTILSAKEARELTGETCEEFLRYLGTAVESAAKDGKTMVTIRKTPYDTWLMSNNNRTDEANKAIKVLQKKGYRLTQYYNEGSMLVDCGLEIHW